MEKYTEVDSLVKFIEIIEKYLSSHHLFRGEKAHHTNRVSVALHSHKGTVNDTDGYPFEKMIDEFYRETSYRVKEVDLKDFIAFAQHHRIPGALSFDKLIFICNCCCPYGFTKMATTFLELLPFR